MTLTLYETPEGTVVPLSSDPPSGGRELKIFLEPVMVNGKYILTAIAGIVSNQVTEGMVTYGAQFDENPLADEFLDGPK